MERLIEKSKSLATSIHEKYPNNVMILQLVDALNEEIDRYIDVSSLIPDEICNNVEVQHVIITQYNNPLISEKNKNAIEATYKMLSSSTSNSHMDAERRNMVQYGGKLHLLLSLRIFCERFDNVITEWKTKLIQPISVKLMTILAMKLPMMQDTKAVDRVVSKFNEFLDEESALCEKVRGVWNDPVYVLLAQYLETGGDNPFLFENKIDDLVRDLVWVSEQLDECAYKLFDNTIDMFVAITQ